jgi:hypothetical protein
MILIAEILTIKNSFLVDGISYRFYYQHIICLMVWVLTGYSYFYRTILKGILQCQCKLFLNQLILSRKIVFINYLKS